MRFDRETRAAIHDATPGPATIRWPSGQGAPEKGRVYRMQSLEALLDAKEKAAQPETHAEVLAEMHKHHYGEYPEGYEPPKRRRVRTSRAEDPLIKVLDVEILERGWEATVALFEDPDPKRHTGIKARVPGGPNPIDGIYEKTETEPEEIVVAPSRREREDAEESLRIESAASVDRAECNRLERKLATERRKGKAGRQTKIALKRARRRVEQNSAAASV